MLINQILFVTHVIQDTSIFMSRLVDVILNEASLAIGYVFSHLPLLSPQASTPWTHTPSMVRNVANF